MCVQVKATSPHWQTLHPSDRPLFPSKILSHFALVYSLPQSLRVKATTWPSTWVQSLQSPNLSGQRNVWQCWAMLSVAMVRSTARVFMLIVTARVFMLIVYWRVILDAGQKRSGHVGCHAA
jgi:hypothetical protein